MIEDGTYAEIFDKWKIEEGLLTSVTLNGGLS
jgi:hypothetical protein